MFKGQNRGIRAALLSAFFLGLAPIFGRQAILLGFSPMAVVAFRTGMAALLLFLLIFFFKRPLLYIFPVGLAGCLLAGSINGIGSIFYYLALERLSASVGQLLYSLYPIFVVFWLFLDRQFPTKLTLIRIGLAVIAVALLTHTGDAKIDGVGVTFMLIASALYALHLPINQRVLYEAPAPTVTLYTLISMSAIVIPAYFLFGRHSTPAGVFIWYPVIGLTLVTFLSRLSLFMGVKHIGGMQTALLGLGELLVTVIVGRFWLKETLSVWQCAGAGLLIASILLVKFEKVVPIQNKPVGGWLSWIRPPATKFPPDLPWGPPN